MPALFLSHSGVDTDAAWALRRRILDAAPHGFDVWFDKDDLDPGRPWQRQIEEAIARSTSFAVYVGSRGVVNWVEAEVRLALERAITEPEYRFIPILAATAPGPQRLPGFARQFQTVSETQFETLIAAVLGTDGAPAVQPEIEPFFGLRAIDESRSHLFFGRQHETDELLRRVSERPIVLVSGDSGSGKSSLVRAGLVPKFRGGALAALRGERASDLIWHVVVTRPRGRPWSELGDAVDEAAKGLGLSLTDRGTLAEQAMSGDPEKARRALRCGLAADQTRVLLVVDQFEELFTATAEADRAHFVRFLLDLADAGDERFKVVLTMRHDYVNLCNSFDALRTLLDADGRRARFILGRMTDEGLESIVTEPLRLARADPSDGLLLARALREEVGTRAGDLALVQMALTETWRERRAHGGNLLAAYAAVGRVEGSLAKAAEDVRLTQLQTAARSGLAPLLDAVLVRLVRLGDTGGATRRLASRDEFDEPRWQLIQLLAGEEGRRLVLLGGSDEQPTAEIAHEALVTAWPHFQNLLQSVVEHKRILDALIPKARAWAAATPRERRRRLASGAELDWFGRLFQERREWISSSERQFITASQVEAARRHRRDQQLRWGSLAAAGVLAALLVFAVAQYGRARDALARSNRSLAASLWNRLDFRADQAVEPDELNALWELRLASLDLREAALRELGPNMDRAARFSRQPSLMRRAFFLRWPNAETADVFSSLLQAVARTKNREDLEVLGGALGALATQMSPSQAREALEPTAAAVAAATDRLQLRVLGQVRFTLTGRLTPSEAKLQLPSMLKVLQSTTDPYQLEVAALALQGLHGELTAEEGQMALDAIVGAIANVKRAVISPETFRSTLRALPDQTAEQAEATLAPLRANDSGDNPFTSRTALLSALQALAPKLQTAQAKIALGVALKELDVESGPAQLAANGSAIEALAAKITADDALAAMKSLQAAITSLGRQEQRPFQPPPVFPAPIAMALTALGDRLTPEQAQAAYTSLLRDTRDRSDPPQMLILGAVLQSIADQLTPAQAAAALGLVISRLSSTFDLVPSQALALAVEPLARALTGTPTFAMLMGVLNRIEVSVDPVVLNALPPAVRPLADSLTPAQQRAALTVVYRGMMRSPSPERRVAWGAAAKGIGDTMEAERVRQVLFPVIQSLAAEVPGQSGVGPLQSMSQMWLAIRAIPGVSTEQESQAALEPLLKALAGGDPVALASQAAAVGSLAQAMTAAQAQTAMTAVLKGMATATESAVFPLLGAAVGQIAPRLTDDARRQAAASARSVLAWAQALPPSVEGAAALVTLLSHEPAERRVRAFVEALKYPTAVGQTTEVLLKGLQEMGAPGPAQSLDDNLDWVATRFPAIDLDAPPECPPPPRAGLSCPSTSR